VSEIVSVGVADGSKVLVEATGVVGRSTGNNDVCEDSRFVGDRKRCLVVFGWGLTGLVSLMVSVGVADGVGSCQ